MESIQGLNEQTDTLSDDLVQEIYHTEKEHLDAFIEATLCQPDAYHLLSIALHLRLITITPEVFNRERLARFLHCIIDIYTARNNNVNYERTLFLAGQLEEFLLNHEILIHPKKPNLGTENIKMLQQITMRHASPDGDFFGYEDHAVKLKSCIALPNH